MKAICITSEPDTFIVNILNIQNILLQRYFCILVSGEISKFIEICILLSQEISVREPGASFKNLSTSLSFSNEALHLINYTVTIPGMVTITLYDISGKQVAVPVHSVSPQGIFSVALKNRLPAGLYWLRMHSPEGELLERITITR